MTEAQRQRVEDFETKDGAPDPQGIVNRWKTELELADDAEKDWRKESQGIWKKYRAERAKSSQQSRSDASFNVLWSNTEIMVPALYNSTPTPDVRRRFKDKDPVGKVVAQILERGLAHSIDTYDFDGEIEASVLDYTLVGRGVTRIRYLPETEPVEKSEETDDEEPEESESEDESEPEQRITAQDTQCEHVQWDDFRRGPGKRWSQVPWLAFRHRMTYDDLLQHFKQDIADLVPLDTIVEDEDDKTGAKRLFATGEVWEIWDKTKRRVLFVCTQIAKPCRIDDEPTLQLQGFFPTPRPMRAILDSASLVPIPLYRQYKAQAEEIDQLTARIEKITRAIKVRGLYVSNLPEAANLLDADDNQMIPIEDAGAVAQVGIDKLIWVMPIDKLVANLEAMYKAREQVKQTIYEIIGLSDIMRGATKATETLGAQELKSRWGSVRLQRMQKEVERFVRDLLRLKGEVIAEHYEPEILGEMTQVKLLTGEQKEQLNTQLEAVKQAAEAAQQEPPPIPPEMQEMLELPTWDEVMAVLRSDAMRQYRVAVESDSTVASMVEADMQGGQEMVQSLAAVFGAIPQLMQAGAQNAPDVAKEIALAMIRRGRFGGRMLEDTIDDLEFGQQPGQMEQIQQMLQELGNAVQQGSQAVAEQGEKVGKLEEIIGQIVKTLQAIPGQQQGQPPMQPQQQPVRAV